MLLRLWLVALLVLASDSSYAWSAGPPARLTAIQEQRVAESDRLCRQANALFEQGKKQETAEALRQGLALERQVYGQVRPTRCDSLSLHARLLEEAEGWTAAKKARLEVETTLSAARGEGHWEVVDARWKLRDCERLPRMTGAQRSQLQQATRLSEEGIGLWQKGKSAQALGLIGQALALRKEVLGENHPVYANTLNNLAIMHNNMGNLEQALPMYQQALALRKEVLGEKHPEYATSLNNLALHHRAMGNHKQALPLYRQAQALYKEVLGEKHPHYATTLINLARLHQVMGDHKQALPLLQQALALKKEVLGEKHADYAFTLNNLASLHQDMGNQKQALPMYRQALALFKEVLGERHPVYANSLNNLAGLYMDMGDHKQALPLYRQAQALNKELLGEKHPHYALTLNNLATLHKAMGDDKQALPLMQQALALVKEVLGEKHPEYASSLNNLAALHSAMGDHKQALPLLQQALALRKEVLGQKHPAYARSLHNLACLHKDMGNHKQALTLYRQALALRKEVLGEKHPDYASSLHNLAGLHLAMKQPDEASRLSEQALDITLANLRHDASVQSERQQLASSLDLRHHLDLRLSLPDPEDDTPSSYRHVLASKGAVFLLQQQRRLFSLVLAGSNRTEVRALAEELQQATRLLASLSQAPAKGKALEARLARLRTLTQEKEDLEARLSLLSADYRDSQKASTISVEQVRRSLPESVVLIDFLFYTRRDPTQSERTKRRVRHLTAFVVHPDGRSKGVIRVDLGQSEPIEKAIASWRQSLGSKRIGKDNPEATLRNRLWLPLARHLGGAKAVLISPDGALATLPFAALPGAKPGTYLIEDIALALVPVPQALPGLLLPVKKEERLKPSLLVVGDINFDNAEAITAGADERGAPGGALSAWKKLPATQAEVSAIKDSFGRLFRGGPITDLREEDATKKAVRAALSKHRYVHLATHGFFAPSEVKSALEERGRPEDLFGREGVTGWHPLLLSGIVLSGANREPKPGEEDGILTALEVSEMDLGKVEIAVLSACETGLGKVAAGEGLLGLQRAFQVAGCRSTITSLWKVDDKATQKLMTHFYKVWWDRKKVVSRIEALRQAQLAMLNEGRARGMAPVDDEDRKARLPPYYWAAFVLSGDWR